MTLGLWHGVWGWGFLTPTSVVEGRRISLQITNNDGGGYVWPYEFRVWKNVTGKPDEQVILQQITYTPFYWENDQPAGTFISFHIIDRNQFYSRTDWIQVSPNPMVTLSILSTMSTASVGTLTATSTGSASISASSSVSSQTQDPTTSTTSSPVPAQTNVGAIAGGVIGGVFILAGIIAALVFFLHRRKSRTIGEKLDLGGTDVPATPFVYDNPYHTRTNHPQTHSGAPQPYLGRSDAPPIYSSPPATLYAQSSQGLSYNTRGVSDRKGNYAPVSTTPQ